MTNPYDAFFIIFFAHKKKGGALLRTLLVLFYLKFFCCSFLQSLRGSLGGRAALGDYLSPAVASQLARE